MRIFRGIRVQHGTQNEYHNMSSRTSVGEIFFQLKERGRKIKREKTRGSLFFCLASLCFVLSNFYGKITYADEYYTVNSLPDD